MSRVIGYGALIVAIILIAVLAARVLAPGAMEGGMSEPLAYRVGWLALLLVALFVGWRQTLRRQLGRHSVFYHGRRPR